MGLSGREVEWQEGHNTRKTKPHQTRCGGKEIKKKTTRESVGKRRMAEKARVDKKRDEYE